VEKIKRDVRITSIYEGTSEIQQSIISTFRWKKTRKSKGRYYESIGEEMDRLASEDDGFGGRVLALAARALNQTVQLVNDHRLTRQQYVMFMLADIMTYVEVGASLARRAFGRYRSGDAQAEKDKLICRLFAGEVSQMASGSILRIVTGGGIFDQKAAADFLAAIALNELTTGCQDMIADMDRLADIVFER
jgi:alkylation response protein AidB-like acyl-CoA dehydrogenase